MNIYETDRLLAEYLLFHYAEPAEVLPYAFGPREALGYPVRCVTECLDVSQLPATSRALDLGCAVGRSTFELARHCHEAIGIDYSRNFIEAANALKARGELPYARRDEGDLTTPLIARPPVGIDPSRVAFETGDAQSLRSGLGQFDVVLMANLIDRLATPQRCLAQLPALVRPGGQLIITSPYTWLEEFTARDQWLGGRQDGAGRLTTREGLQRALSGTFDLVATRDLPFLIREHVRKYQWSVAEATLWHRKNV